MKVLLDKLALLTTGAILGALLVANVAPLRNLVFPPRHETVVEITHKTQPSKPLSILEITDVKDLPKAVFDLVADSEGKMANPGEDWNEFDFSFPSSPPQTRLIWAASFKYGSIYIVAFEGRGYVKYTKTIVAEYDGVSATVIWPRETK